jgi:hypothetical protein
MILNRHKPATDHPQRRLPRSVVVIGLVSLLNDFASEMVTPLIPLLLATVLGAGPMALGFIEGLADTTTNLLKLWAAAIRVIRCPFTDEQLAAVPAIRPDVAVIHAQKADR